MAARKSKRATERAPRHTPVSSIPSIPLVRSRSARRSLSRCLERLNIILATAHTTERALRAARDCEAFAVTMGQHVVTPLLSLRDELAALQGGSR